MLYLDSRYSYFVNYYPTRTWKVQHVRSTFGNLEIITDYIKKSVANSTWTEYFATWNRWIQFAGDFNFRFDSPSENTILTSVLLNAYGVVLQPYCQNSSRSIILSENTRFTSMYILFLSTTAPKGYRVIIPLISGGLFQSNC